MIWKVPSVGGGGLNPTSKWNGVVQLPPLMLLSSSALIDYRVCEPVSDCCGFVCVRAYQMV